LLYITAYGENFKLSMPITGDNRLQTYCDILESYFLIPDLQHAMFVAWNGNNYDSYFVAHSLLKSSRWIIQPYMTASKALRGLRVKSKDKVRINGKMRVLQFQFLDGIAMTGMVGKSLKQFLSTFAPELPKLDIGNFEEIDFNPKNPDHVAYAERDSQGLYVGMKRVENIIYDLTQKPLKPTVGNLAVHYFMENVPKGVLLKEPSVELKKILHGPVKRGGYCWCQKPFTGKVWKYDINQAYAAAMRDAPLPCGEVTHTRKYVPEQSAIYQCEFSRAKSSQVPFYYKVENDGIGRFTLGDKPVSTWLTSIEVDHLRRDGWNVKVIQGFCWAESFNFKATIDKLEQLRSTDSSGPSGPLGTMVKAIGNNAYGKTLELLNGVELIIAQECPDGYDVYDPFDSEYAMIYSRSRIPFRKKYHVPQIGVFVTAYVRCFVRSTAMLAPSHFIYADTDCVVFSKPVKLPIHKTRYGDWKVEAEGIPYIIIGKKIYYGDDGSTKAKGLRTKELSKPDYEKWLREQPKQTQVQRQNFLKFLSGNAMFKNQDRKGTDVEKSKVYKLKSGRYVPS
jgi:hypothetical protein